MRKANTIRALAALLLCSAPLTLGSPPGLASAQDVAGGAQAQSIQLLETHPLFQWHDRPTMRIPVGASFTVHVAHGVTDADLYATIRACQRKQSPSYAFCVADSQVHLHRQGGDYVIEVTSSARPVAMEIQQRAKSSAGHRRT